MNIRLPQKILIPLTLLIFCLLIYANSLNHDFLLDDHTLLLNASIDPNFLQLTSGTKEIYFRPLLHMFCALMHHFFGVIPFGYHMVNLLVFYLACLSFYYLTLRLFDNSLIALIAGLLMIVHPINGTLINFKMTTGYGFLIIAVNLALLQLLKKPLRNIHYALSAVFLFAALLCHEIAIAFPFYMAAILLIVKQKTFKETYMIGRFCIPVLAGYLFLRACHVAPQSNIVHNFSSLFASPAYLPAAWAKLTAWYISQLLLPTQIVLIKDISVLPNEILQWNIIFVLGGFLLILLLNYYKNNRAASLGLWWLIISFLPVIAACASRPEMGIIIEPHWLVFGSLGFFLWLAAALTGIEKTIRRPVWLALISVLLLSYVISAIGHNKNWADQKTYCEYWLKSSPNNFWINFTIGVYYFDQQNYQQAKHYFLRSVINGKAGVQVWEMLGRVEDRLGNDAAARMYFEAVLARQPGNPIAQDYLK